MNTPATPPVQEMLSHTLAFCDDCLSRKDYTAAWQALSRAVSLAPQRPDILRRRDRLALFLKDTETAKCSIAEALNAVGSQPSGVPIVAMDPFIAVIVPTYNQCSFLAAALESLLAQTHPKWEAIVVNDGSTDDTSQILAQYAAKDPRIRVYHKPNGGTASALNEGLKHTTADWICWLSSDDLFEPDALEVHAREIVRCPDARFFHSGHSLLDDATGIKRSQDLWRPDWRFQTLGMFASCWVHANSFCMHRSVITEVGIFDENNRNAHDFDMWLRVSRKYPLHYIHTRTTITRIHPAQATAQFFEAGVYDCLHACIKYLNEHSFPELFPRVDLSDDTEVQAVLAEVAKLYLNANAFINSCGYQPALLERLQEWLTSETQRSIKTAAICTLRQILTDFEAHEVPVALHQMFSCALDTLNDRYVYKPHDFVYEMTARAGRYLEENDINKAESIKRYMANNIFYTQGLTQSNAGEYWNAAALFKKALALEPNHEKARQKLVEVQTFIDALARTDRFDGRMRPEDSRAGSGAQGPALTIHEPVVPALLNYVLAPIATTVQTRCQTEGAVSTQGALRILLISPPFNRFLGLQNARFPLTFGNMATLLAQRGYVARIYDADFDPALLGKSANYEYSFTHQHLVREALDDENHPVWQEIRSTLQEFKPDIVGLTTMTSKYPMVIRIAELAKATNPEVAICVGGHHVSVFGEGIMNRAEFDFAVVGEGDLTMLELADCLAHKTRNFGSVRGLIYRSEGKLVKTPPRELLRDLDLLPMADRALMLNGSFVSENNIIASRGCPFSCSYCGADVIWMHKVRRRSVASIMKEVRYLIQRTGSRHINFWDDSFTHNRKFITELMSALQQIAGLTFSCITRLDLLDQPMLELLKASGCVNMLFGIESGNDRILELVNKGLTREKIKAAANLVDRVGIPWIGFFIMGYPGESRETVLQTLEFMRELNPPYAEINMFNPLPGTQVWNDLVNQGHVRADMDFSRCSQASTENSYIQGMTPDEFRELALMMAREFDQHNAMREATRAPERAASAPPKPSMRPAPAPGASCQATLRKWTSGATKNLPTQAHFLLNDKCNAKCVMCGGEYFGSQSGRKITLEIFTRMATNLKLERFRGIVLARWGDPLLNPDLVPIIKWVNDQYATLAISITTNGIALASEMSRALLKQRINEINISINSATRKTYKRILQVDCFEQVCQNVRMLAQFKRESGSGPRLQLSSAIHRLNIEELPALVELGAKLGVDSINLMYCRFYPEWIRQPNLNCPENALKNEDSLFYHQELSDVLVIRAKQMAAQSRLRLTHEPLFRDHASAQPCGWIESSLMVGFDGEVYPCGGAEVHMRDKVQGGVYHFGNVLKESIEECWNSDHYRALRVSARQGPDCCIEECRHCANLMAPNELKAHIMHWNEDVATPSKLVAVEEAGHAAASRSVAALKGALSSVEQRPDEADELLRNSLKTSEAVTAPGHAEPEVSSTAPMADAAPPGPAAPAVSVIVPTFNRPAMLIEALRSILAQSWQDFEIIVVNDAGEDVSAVIDTLGAYSNIRHIRHEVNKGLAAARNTGIKAARGKYIAYLDDDDIFQSNHLQTLIEHLEATNGDVAYTDAYRGHQRKNGDTYEVFARDVPYSFDFDYDRILENNFIPVLCFMHRKSCWEAVGGFDESLPVLEDWDLWIRMSRLYDFAHIAKVTCEFRWRTDGSSMTVAENGKFEGTHQVIVAKRARLPVRANVAVGGVMEPPDAKTPLPREGATATFLKSGFYGDEGGWCWMEKRGRLLVCASAVPAVFRAQLACGKLGCFPEDRRPLEVALFINGEFWQCFRFETDIATLPIELEIPASAKGLVIELVSNMVFIPAETGASQDARHLSVQLVHPRLEVVAPAEQPTEPARVSAKESIGAVDKQHEDAQRLWEACDWEGAGNLYQMLTNCFPNDLAAWRGRIVCSRRQGHSVLADLIMDEAVEKHPEWAVILKNAH